MPDEFALTEVQVADRIGFSRFKDFTRSLKQGLIPAPSKQLPDGPRWSEKAIRAWLDEQDNPRSLADEENALIRRIQSGA